MAQPTKVKGAQVAEGVQVATIWQAQQMQGRQGATVPIQVGEKKKAGVRIGVYWRGTIHDIFLFGEAVKDIEDPIKAAIGAVALDVRQDVVAVDGRGFGDGASALGGVFGDVLWCAGIDEIDLEVWWGRPGLRRGCGYCAWTRRRKVPVVDVVGAEISDGGQALCKVLKVSYIGAERGALLVISFDAQHIDTIGGLSSPLQ